MRGSSTMSKITLTSFMLSLVLLLTSFDARSRNPATKNSPGNQLQRAHRNLSPAVAPPLRRRAKAGNEGGTGTLQKNGRRKRQRRNGAGCESPERKQGWQCKTRARAVRRRCEFLFQHPRVQ